MSHDDEVLRPPTDDRTPPTPTTPTPDETGATMHADTAAHPVSADPSHDDPAYRPFDAIPTPSPTFTDRPLDEPLPYGTGFAATQAFGYGVAPEPAPASTTSTAVARRERGGSPTLAIAGLLSMGVAVWAIVGAPAISTAVVWAAGLVVAVLVGLLMVVRR